MGDGGVCCFFFGHKHFILTFQNNKTVLKKHYEDAKHLGAVVKASRDAISMLGTLFVTRVHFGAVKFYFTKFYFTFLFFSI